MKILTIDVEDWFHILDHASTKSESFWGTFESRLERNVDALLTLLAKKQIRATFFCLGWVARKHPHVVRNIVLAGHEIGCHSDLHQLVYEQAYGDFTVDLKTAIDSLEAVSSKKIRTYRAPGFSINRDQIWALEALIENGIEIDCSIFPAPRGHGGFPDFPGEGPCKIRLNGGLLKEFPINTTRFLTKQVIFSGGGYFRLFPYGVLRSMFKKADYVMTYFHPRDFDPLQPLLPGLSLRRRFKSYYGLASSMGKLEQLLDDFGFVDLSTADLAVNWSEIAEINLKSLCSGDSRMRQVS